MGMKVELRRDGKIEQVQTLMSSISNYFLCMRDIGFISEMAQDNFNRQIYK